LNASRNGRKQFVTTIAHVTLIEGTLTAAYNYGVKTNPLSIMAMRINGFINFEVVTSIRDESRFFTPQMNPMPQRGVAIFARNESAQHSGC
jgi:hypothetical protein